MTVRLFDLAIGDLEPAALAVARFSGTEHIGKLFRFSITFGADPASVGAPEALLGVPARLVVHDTRGEARRIQGIVGRIALRALEESGLGWYDISLVPRLWLARRRNNCRVFQDLSVPEIVALLFEEHGVRFEKRLFRSYGPRTYCVQYQESDFAFAMRLLAEEGIFHWFEDPPDGTGLETGELLVIADQESPPCRSRACRRRPSGRWPIAGGQGQRFEGHLRSRLYRGKSGESPDARGRSAVP